MQIKPGQQYVETLHQSYATGIAEDMLVAIGGCGLVEWNGLCPPYGVVKTVDRLGAMVITSRLFFTTSRFDTQSIYHPIHSNCITYDPSLHCWRPTVKTASKKDPLSQTLARMAQITTAGFSSNGLELEYDPLYYTHVQLPIPPQTITFAEEIESGCTCSNCNEFYPYAVKKEKFICYSCKSFRSMFE